MGFDFDHEHDGTLSIESAVYQALGYASMAWTEGPRGVFREEMAREAADALLDLINENPEPEQDTPAPPELALASQAWTIIANVSEGDWSRQTEEWQAGATRWREDFHAALDATRPEEPTR